jgi:SOS-response transcriptional repressor LexA
MPRPRSNLSGHLGALQDYFVTNGVIPSLTELGKLWGIAGRAWTHRVVARLKEEGFLEEAAGKRLKPGTRFFERTVADTVRAGMPQPANDSPRDAWAIDHYLVDKPSETELFQVRGDSMIDAGIHEGDFVVVEKTRSAMPGDVVLAFVDGEFTLKTLARDKKGFYLEAANAAYAPIRPEQALEIHGVMVGLFRKTVSPRIGHTRPRR